VVLLPTSNRIHLKSLNNSNNININILSIDGISEGLSNIECNGKEANLRDEGKEYLKLF